ncbi:MAG: glycosyltransferase [Rhodospirillales bacterium]
MSDGALTVVQVVQHLRPGGVETMALDLMIHASAGRDVRIVALEGTAEDSLNAWPRLADTPERLHFMNKKPGLDLFLIFRLARYFKQIGAQAVHTHHIGPLIYGGLAARLAGISAAAHTEHDAWHLESRWRRFVQRLALALVRPVFTASAEAVARAARSALPGHNPKVILNGVDLRRFSPGARPAARLTLGLPTHPFIIGCAARLAAVKRHVDLTDALRRLPANVHLALAGDGPERSALEKRVKAHGLRSRVHFLGAVDDMPAFYRAIDVFCLASENEGMPLAPLEAQASGVPCVLTDAGGAAEALCRETGMLTRPHDPGGLANALALLLARENTGDPRAFVRRHHDFMNTIRAYESLHTV